MSVSTVGGQSALAIQQLVAMRAQFDDLQRQLSTGQKSSTYAGLGVNSGVTVSLNAQLAAISGYDSTIGNVGTRISLMNTALGQMTSITSNVKAAMVQANTTGAGNGNGPSVAQQTAQSSLDQLLGLLNTQAAGRYLFSGRATDQPAVETTDHILNGNGSQAGLKQLISERTQADLGASGLGRLVISQPSSTDVSVAEDSTSPFGLKLASVTSNLTNATVSPPTGAPASLDIDLSGGNPNAGETVSLRFNLPDGTSQNLTLTATNSATPSAGQFTIGATSADTALNLQNAVTAGITTLGATSLTAASAVAASNDFFDADLNNPPQRVNGPPFDTATGMTAGTAANSVVWYTGEPGTGPARATATARIDTSLSVSYGARANEQGFRDIVQNIATLAALPISASDPNAAQLSSALNQRLNVNLSGVPGAQTITNIATDLASAQTAMKAASDRHSQTSATLGDFLQSIEGVSSEQVGTELLALQTRMQAAMQTTAMLFQTSLVNYMK
jgi:flagellin-like hook-associated protein FlgL